MRELFTLIGRIAIDNKDANASIDETTEKGRGAEGKLSSAFSKAGSAAVKVGKAVATGLAVGATAMTTLVGAALNAGGSLEQNIGGSEAVFKQHAQGMQDTANEAYKNMGLSASDFLATANKMGALFQGSGFGIEESADLSAKAMQRAADVASIMGIDTASAMEAVAGAAKGNYTMMDNLGVAMNETALEAYALSKGIEKSTQDMSQQEKTALAMEMFLEKTAYAAGNYAKENETLAGSLGTAKSAMANFLSGAGDASQVAAAFTNAGKVVIENVKQLLPGLVGGLKELITALVPEIPALLNSLLPAVVDGAVALVNGVVEALPAIISALMNALPAILAGMQQIFTALIQALPQIMETLVAALPSLLPQIIEGIVQMIVLLATMLPQLIQPIIDHLPEIIISIVTALLNNLPALIEGAIALVIGLVAALPQIVIALVEAMPQVVMMLVNGLLSANTLLADAFTGLFAGAAPVIDWFRQLINDSMENIKLVFQTALDFIAGVVGSFISVFQAGWSEMWEKAKSALTAARDFIVNVFNMFVSTISSAGTNVWSAVKNAFENIRSAIVDKLTQAKDAVVNIFKAIKDTINEKIENAKNIVKAGIDKLKGFLNFSWELPKIKLPHLKISGQFSLNPPSIPTIGVDWYKKAMDSGMILDSPTIFGINQNGQPMGAGEAGSETVVGTDSLMGMIRQAVDGDGSTTVLQEILGTLQQLVELIKEANGDIVIPVTIGNESIEELIIDVKSRIARRSGGRAYA